MREDIVKLPDLPIVELETEHSSLFGMLYLDTKSFVVILNAVIEGVDYGPLKHFVDTHFVPEGMVTVYPRQMVKKVHRLVSK